MKKENVVPGKQRNKVKTRKVPDVQGNWGRLQNETATIGDRRQTTAQNVPQFRPFTKNTAFLLALVPFRQDDALVMCHGLFEKETLNATLP